MSNCGNKIQKKQVDWVPYTTDPDEFCTISPGGTITPTLADSVLLEDDSNGNAKACTTLQQIKDLIESTSSLPPYDCIEDRAVKTVLCETAFTVLSFTTISVPAGQYRVGWAYFWNTSKTRRDIVVDIYLDGVLQRTHQESPATVHNDATDAEFDNTCNDQQIPASGFLCPTFGVEETHLIEIKIRTESTTYQASIWDINVDIQRTA